jgi:hypothetical protein
MKVKHTLNRLIVEKSSFDELYIECPVCTKPVCWKHRVQVSYQNGGVGHECSNCKSYIGGVFCSNCNSRYLMDDKQWCSITDEKPFTCSECLEPLVPKVEKDFSFSTRLIEKTNLKAFTTDKREKGFIADAKRCLNEQSQDALSIYHETTFERIKLAEYQLDILMNLDTRISFVISNNKDLYDSNNEHIETDNKHHSIIYVLVLALFSALESLLHEINLACDLGLKEWKVDDNMLLKIPLEFPILKRVCLDILKQEDFLYLKDLRNLLTHRRLTLLALNASYEFPHPSPFRPYTIRAKCITYLPDKPIAEIGSETYNNKKELKQTLKKSYDFICDTKERVYEALSIELRNRY